MQNSCAEDFRARSRFTAKGVPTILPKPLPRAKMYNEPAAPETVCLEAICIAGNKPENFL